jgi:hypothetical protein
MLKTRATISRFLRTILIVVGVVLIWRGLWELLDAFDAYFYGGSHEWTALGGIILGFIILYVLDRDWQKIESLLR